MDSQESDLCNPEDMAHLLNEPGLTHLINDWINAPSAMSNPTGELPARNDWPGIHLFETKVDFTGPHKKHYVMSSKLKRLYVDMDKVVPFQVCWDGTTGLFVRALMMFSQADHLKTPVRRCLTHRDKDDPTNRDYDYNDHVLASLNDNSTYHSDDNSQRFSVLVPLHLQQGCDHALINYKFMCKTSCTGGLNRVPTDIIFTLEDSAGMVLGRHVIGVKICSCPKRDKEKDENNMDDPPGKRKAKVRKEEKKNQHEPAAKRIKTEYNSEDQNQLTSAFPYSFTVCCPTPQIAENLKAHVRKWNDVMSVEWVQPSSTGEPAPPPLIRIIDEVAVLPQPYL